MSPSKPDYQAILAEKFLEINDNLIKYIDRIDNSLSCLNDNSTLHSKLMSSQNEILKAAVETNRKNMRNFWILLGVLTAAAVINSGAEKALKFLPFL